MQRAAIYARYSTDGQRATSIDDQVRRAREKAVSLGYEVPEDLIFSDSAITGQEHGLAKRVGYQRFLDAFEKRQFQAVVVDELCRVDRDSLGIATLQDKIERSGIRFISTDGLDSNVPGWQLTFGLQGVMASHAIRETRHRVVRGMIGQLERGYMIAAAPFGYRMRRADGDAGTFWEKHETEEKLVGEIFALRRQGASFVAIARSLNERGIVSPRPSRKNNVPRYWRPATVRQLLGNTIYRGVFVWNGSAFAKAKAKKNHKELQSIEYQRPSLRIVEDDLWFECNKPSAHKAFRGGGKNILAGLLTCGVCHAKLTISSGGSALTAHCAQCSQAKRVGVADRTTRYVSIDSIKMMLTYVMEKLLSDDEISKFRALLREKLNQGQDGKIAEIRREISLKERTASRFLDLIGSAEIDDPILNKNYKEAISEKARLQAELSRIEAGLLNQDVASIERQLAINPTSLLPRLFEGSLPPERVRAVLSKLFPVIRLDDKPRKFIAKYHVEVSQGSIYAELSESNVVDEGIVELNLIVSGGAARPSCWIVSEV
ncbi:recombinase family protein [Undibacterium seohonense]|uniref:Recombinase family protein n=1 Tax=Undibacterium seohonense TaxID=1344950 RepID=A0ABR6X6N9_9BURK|nr:recombinase family protein [Undibacterium seohonense]MBC3808496.1 recombinase family protein [Undibacterium seohonense]